MCNVNPNTPFGASLSNVCPNTGALNYCSKLPQFKQVADCLDHEWAQESSGKLQDPQSYCSQQTYGGGQGSYADYLSCAATQTSGTPQFCEETNFATGNGICTSQLGSIPCEAGTKGCDQTVGGIPISDSQGEFNTVITACGSRMDQIVADYYGWPPPEPLPTVQVPLQFSANLINKNCEKSTDTGALNPLCNQFVQDELQSTQNMQSEFDYNYSPTQTVVPVQIGTMELGYGSVSLAAMLAAMATSLLLIFWKGPWLRAPRRKRAGKAYVLIGKNA
jgi:hypothetical protein